MGDVTAAFLQSDPIKEQIAVPAPPEAGLPPGHLLRLVNNACGRCSAPRAWCEKLARHLVDALGFERSLADPCLFRLKEDGSFLVVHVDDLMWTTLSPAMAKAMEQLRKDFKFSETSTDSVERCGVKINDNTACGELTFSLAHYIRSCLTEVPVDESAVPSSVESEVRSALGMMQCVAGVARPDIACTTSALSGVVADLRWDDVREVNKLVRYLHHTANAACKLSKMDMSSAVMMAFSDAAFRNMPGERSQGGHLACLRDDHGVVNLIDWSSARLVRKVRCTFTAELSQVMTMADDTLFLRELLRFSYGVDLAANVRCDCLSLVRNTHSYSRSVRQKSVMPDLNALHEMLVTGDVASLEHVPSRLNPADGTTKPDHTLRIPILRLLSGVDVLWKHDPMVTGLFRPKPTY